MLNQLRTGLKAAALAAALLPISVLADIVTLSATLNAANQNGSDPALITDPLGVVPTSAFGTINIALDTERNTLDFYLDVTGIDRSQLRNFGPNATPIHLHLAGGGNPGNFGPIAVDLSLNAVDADFTDTATGFKFSRKNVSILLEDQGGVQLGMHPGNDQIVDALQTGNAFVLVHSTKDIFVNDTGPVPGFPFGEIRGNITRDPVAAMSGPAVGMDIIVLNDATDVPSAVAKLTAQLERKGFRIPVTINHSGASASVGLNLAPNQLIFARPPRKLEKRLLRKGATIGIDLPLKFHVFEANGVIKLNVNTLGYLIDRHELSIRDFTLHLTDKLIEQFGNSGDAGHGLITIKSTRSLEETAQELQDTISANPAARIPLVLNYGDDDNDRGRHYYRRHRAPSPILIVFGNPNTGTPLMQADPRIGIDLPLKFLVWQNRRGEVMITYNDMQFLAGRVNLQGLDNRLGNIANALDNIATAAAGN